MTENNHIQNGDISVTTLIDSPQIPYLKKTVNYDMDVIELIHVFLGSAIHEKIEEADPLTLNQKAFKQVIRFFSGYKSDNDTPSKISKYLKAFFVKILPTYFEKTALVEHNMSQEFEGVILSGTLDRYIFAEKKIRDYKTITGSQMLFKETKDSWYVQQNIYAYMLRKEGYEVEKLEIVAIVKDWSKMKVIQSKDYPRSPIVVMELNIASDEEIESYIKKRIRLHKRSWEGEVVPCTNNDRWAKADMFKVKSKGLKKAVRNFDDKKMAEKFMEENEFRYPPQKALYIETVPAESFRCAHYCPVSNICPQYQKELASKANQAEETF
jgi:hypothetical protein